MNERTASSPPLVLYPMRRGWSVSFTAPGLKSIANRAILLAGVANGVSTISGVPDSDDVKAAFSVLQELGIGTELVKTGVVRVHGRGLAFPTQYGDFSLGTSGTLGRCLVGLLAAAPQGAWRLRASGSLATRPLGPLLSALRSWGADIQGESHASFPLQVRSRGLSGGAVEISAAASAQFAAGLLMASPFARIPVTVNIVLPNPDDVYIPSTLDLMRLFGVRTMVDRRPDIWRVRIDSPLSYHAANVKIPADSTSGNYVLALAALLDGDTEVVNYPSSGQNDVQFLDVLAQFGCRIGRIPGGGVRVAGGKLPLRGGFEVDVRTVPDMALLLGVMAPFADAPVVLSNTGAFREHATERIASLLKFLSKAGVEVERGDKSIRICPADPSIFRPVEIDSPDHRLVIAFSIFGLAAQGAQVWRQEVVTRSFPDFFRMLVECGAVIH